jgi:hypothetical protein
VTIARHAVLLLTCAAVVAVLTPARAVAQTAPAQSAPAQSAPAQAAPARGAPAPAASAPSVAGQTPIAAVHAWGEAFNSRDPKRIVARYAPAAVLWGTTAKAIATTPAQIWDYFKDAGQRPAIRVTIDSTFPRVIGDVAIVSGAYTFADVKDGATTNVRPARYTLVFQRVGGAWLIVEHHSSRVPES